MEHPKLRLTIPWESMELEAQQQIIRVLAMPEVELLAVMPDVHAGYDLCIGGVALLRGVVSPSFVGYDIGCGMCHVDTERTRDDLGLTRPKDCEQIFLRLQEAVPSGLGAKGNNASDFVFRSACADKDLDRKIEPLIYSQFGTLGSGNHFLEIGENSRGHVGVTIHSGSRRPGYDIASWYMKQGRLLRLDGDLGQAYVADMNWAMGFALANRRKMLESALTAMKFHKHDIAKLLAPECVVNENHNHAVPYGDGRFLHRKGATPAETGQVGIIPANQRDGVWITRGLGNAQFLSSASHGAGRVLSRKAAANKGTVADLQKLMKGIVCRADKAVLDEAPWAYKKIDAVLAAQDGILVDVVDHFTPLIVLKG